MIRTTHHEKQTSRSLLGWVFVVVAMVMQVALSAEHAGASVIQMTQAAPYNATLGFLDLCLSSETDTEDDSPGEGCPVCLNAAAFGFDLPDAVATSTLVTTCHIQTFRALRSVGGDANWTRSGNRPRAPPVSGTS